MLLSGSNLINSGNAIVFGSINDGTLKTAAAGSVSHQKERNASSKANKLTKIKPAMNKPRTGGKLQPLRSMSVSLLNHALDSLTELSIALGLRTLNQNVTADNINAHKRASCLTKKAEPPPTRDVNRDSGTDSANGGWLRRLVRRHHFDTSLVFTLIVMFVAGTLVPFIVMAPKNHVLLPSEIATGLLPGGGVVELLGDFLPQPAIRIVTTITPMMIAFFIMAMPPSGSPDSYESFPPKNRA